MSQKEKTEDTYPTSKLLLKIINMLEEGAASIQNGETTTTALSTNTKLPKANAEYDIHFASLQKNLAEDIKKFVAREKQKIEEFIYAVSEYTRAAMAVDKATTAPSAHGSPSKPPLTNTKQSDHGTPSKPPVINVGQIGQMAKQPQHVRHNSDWRQFMTTEKMKIQEHQHLMARRDQVVKVKDLKSFAESFKLKTEAPPDLLPYLAKDEQKQAKIIKKTRMAANYAAIRAAYNDMWCEHNEARVLSHVAMIQDLPRDTAKHYKNIFKLIYDIPFEDAEDLVTYLPMVQIVNMRATLMLYSDLLDAELREHFKFLVHIALCLYKKYDTEDLVFKSEMGKPFVKFVAAVCKVDLWADKETAAYQMWKARAFLPIY